MPASLPYWRLSSFYFFFFAIVGSLVPYWGPYLRSLGYSAAAIGELIAIMNLMRILAPNVWGWLVDHYGHRMRVVRLAACCACLAFAGVLLGSSFWWLALVMSVFSFFWNAALPQFEANTMNHLGREEHRYSRIRLWGSLGFICAVVALGGLIDRFDEAVVPWAVLGLFAALWVSSLLAPGREQEQHRDAPADEAFWKVLRRPEVIGFLAAAFLSQMSHGPYYAFFSIYLQEHGYRGELIGLLWAWGVIAEIGVFVVMHRWLPRFGPRWLMTAALLLAALRWFVIGALPDSLVLLFAAQTLHAASFGVYHAVGIAVVNRWFRGRSQGRGQAVYSSMTFGAGVALGSLVSGYLWTWLGGSQVFYLAGGLALLAAAFAWRAVPRHFASPAPQH